MQVEDTRRRSAIRLLAGLGIGAGLALLVAPQRVAGAVAPEFPARRLWVARVLGARLLVQHGAVLVAPDRRLVQASSAVDLLHAASMVPLVASPRYGRAARVSGGLAALSAVVAAVLAHGSERR